MATYNKIQVEDKNEGTKIAWEQSKTKIIFGDDDLAIRCDTRQRDIPVTVDVCMDDQNNLTIGTGTGRYYVAQVEIPAQKFVEVEDPAEDVQEATEQAEDAENQGTANTQKTHVEAVPLDMADVKLILWSLDDLQPAEN
mgnify:CR=1 FL=1